MEGIDAYLIMRNKRKSGKVTFQRRLRGDKEVKKNVLLFYKILKDFENESKSKFKSVKRRGEVRTGQCQ